MKAFWTMCLFDMEKAFYTTEPDKIPKCSLKSD